MLTQDGGERREPGADGAALEGLGAMHPTLRRFCLLEVPRLARCAFSALVCRALRNGQDFGVPRAELGDEKSNRAPSCARVRAGLPLRCAALRRALSHAASFACIDACVTMCGCLMRRFFLWQVAGLSWECGGGGGGRVMMGLASHADEDKQQQVSMRKHVTTSGGHLCLG
ncbi:hypothetical protein BS50DRAFT_355219 [Corynespora cassiicola Philippines]|uniref:Uncharacterized protein n=1 Tax=Corynespora cassiicola Philippines TaxID=1448308 RepID=A0A2T2NSF9_CORCC|nr:hypothetical protein BS50DRAFT_355219 [Corynespora cassiicola Philippines]